MRSHCLILLAYGSLQVGAQNLVVNPSFEEYDYCPTDLSQIESAAGWEGIFFTPDYFNACADDTMTVPYNPLGYQWPSDGFAYAGLGFYDIWYKEYMQGRLVAPVQPGVLTYVSMRVSPGGFGYPGWTSPNLMASHIGLRFSTQPLDIQTAYGSLEHNTAVLYLPTTLNDTANWTVLSTTFIPDSAYAYLQIGNFFSDSLCSWVEVDTMGFGMWLAYAFVDMVCVSQQPGVCDAVNGLGEHLTATIPQGIAFSDVLEIPCEAWGLSGAAEQADLFDARGRLLRSSGMEGRSTLQWQLADLPTGLYVLVVQLRDRPSVRIRSLKY